MTTIVWLMNDNDLPPQYLPWASVIKNLFGKTIVACPEPLKSIVEVDGTLIMKVGNSKQ